MDPFVKIALEQRRRRLGMDEYQVKRLGGLAGFAADVKEGLIAVVVLGAIIGAIGGAVINAGDGPTIEGVAVGAVIGALGLGVLLGPLMVIGTLTERLSPGQMRAAHLIWIGIIGAAIASRQGQ